MQQRSRGRGRRRDPLQNIHLQPTDLVDLGILRGGSSPKGKASGFLEAVVDRVLPLEHADQQTGHYSCVRRSLLRKRCLEGPPCVRSQEQQRAVLEVRFQKSHFLSLDAERL